MIKLSKQNPQIKHAKAVQTKKYSQEFCECFLETAKIIVYLLEQKKNIKEIFILESSKNKYESIIKNYNGKILYIDNIIANYLSETESGSDIFAILDLKDRFISNSNNFLVLESLQDPSNVGAIIRSAKAFGFDKIYSINSAYPYTYKVIRSSMGYVFDVEIININVDEFIDIKNKNNLYLYVADMDGVNVNNIKHVSNFGLVIGNEGQGVSDKIKSISNSVVSIQMEKNVESLNASVSAGILMFALKN